MLHVERRDEIDQLRQMANHLEADFIEDDGAAVLNFDNAHGKGRLTTYQVFPGMVAKTYDVNFTKELRFTKKEKGGTPSYFIYCVSGYYYHKFSNELSLEKISENQNVILTSSKVYGHEIILPSGVDLKISLIFIDEEKLSKSTRKKARRLERALASLSKKLELGDGERYFSETDPGTSNFASLLVSNDRIDIIGTLITEGALLNTLASQLLALEKSSIKGKSVSLSKSELKSITKIGDYVNLNIERRITINELSKVSGINPKKLQEGFQYLYGESISNLVQRIRMEKARQLLQNTNLTASEICYKIGISSRSYFSKLFFETYGIKPSVLKRISERKNMVYELCYKSKVVEGIKEQDFIKILKSSKNNNDRDDITGALVYHAGVFFQIVEGPKIKILELYDRLLKDVRHFDVKLIWRGLKSERTFADWDMAFLTSKGKKSKIKLDGTLDFVNLKPIIDEVDEHGVFSDILWRRVRNILKTKT